MATFRADDGLNSTLEWLFFRDTRGPSKRFARRRREARRRLYHRNFCRSDGCPSDAGQSEVGPTAGPGTEAKGTKLYSHRRDGRGRTRRHDPSTLFGILDFGSDNRLQEKTLLLSTGPVSFVWVRHKALCVFGGSERMDEQEQGGNWVRCLAPECPSGMTGVPPVPPPVGKTPVLGS